MLLRFTEGVCLTQHRTCHIWEARTHLLCYICTHISPPQNLSLFSCLLPPLTFQEKYYKYSLKQVFSAHFECLRKPVVMALSQGIFLRCRTWSFLGIVSFSTERNLFKNRTKQNKTPQILSLCRMLFLSFFFFIIYYSTNLMPSLRKSVGLLGDFYIKPWPSNFCSPICW